MAIPRTCSSLSWFHQTQARKRIGVFNYHIATLLLNTNLNLQMRHISFLGASCFLRCRVVMGKKGYPLLVPFPEKKALQWAAGFWATTLCDPEAHCPSGEVASRPFSEGTVEEARRPASAHAKLKQLKGKVLNSCFCIFNLCLY